MTETNPPARTPKGKRHRSAKPQAALVGPAGRTHRLLKDLGAPPEIHELTPALVLGVEHGPILLASLGEERFSRFIGWLNTVKVSLVNRFWETARPSNEHALDDLSLAEWQAWADDHAAAYVMPILEMVETMVVHSHLRPGGRLPVQVPWDLQRLHDAAVHIEKAALILAQSGFPTSLLRLQLQALPVQPDSLGPDKLTQRPVIGKVALLDLDLHGGRIYQMLMHARCMPLFGWKSSPPERRDPSGCGECIDSRLQVEHQRLQSKQAHGLLTKLLGVLGIRFETKRQGNRSSTTTADAGTAAKGLVDRFRKKYVRGDYIP